MKYTKEERLYIGRRIYDGEISRYEAAEEYGINDQTARTYMRLYRDTNQLPPKNGSRGNGALKASSAVKPADLEKFKSMTREELIHELVKARTAEARLRKNMR